MSDSPGPFWPGSREFEVLVDRAVAAQVQPLRAQMVTVGRALAILAERMPPTEQVDDLGRTVVTAVETAVAEAVATAVDQAVTRVEAARAADTSRILEQMAALSSEERTRQGEAEEFRQAVTTAIEQAVVWIESAITTDNSRILEQLATREDPLARTADAQLAQADDLRTAVIATLETALTEIETTRSADATRVLERVAALEAPLVGETLARQEQLEDLRRTVATTIDQAVGRIETVHTADAARILEQVADLTAKAELEAQRRNDQAAAMLTTVDERLQSLHRAGVQDGEGRETRLIAQLESLAAENGQALLARIDERTAAIPDLEAIPVRVAAEVKGASTDAVTSQLEPIVTQLIEAIDTLAHEGGRIEALSRGQAGEAHAVEERVATMFAEVAVRAEAAVDHSRARIAEGQVALGSRFDSILGEMLGAIDAAAERLEAKVAESMEGLRAAGGHQNGALLDAVNHSTKQLGDALADIRSTLLGGLEPARDPRIEALVVEQVAGREAQIAAIEAVGGRIDEVGPAVANALLAEVERAVRSANAAEEAVANLSPQALRASLGESSQRAADEVQAVARRLEEELTVLADLRASQAILRETVQDGAHKAELAAVDIRGLRDRLTPHLVALAEATTRRAEADQAGFDAVLARLDQLLAARQP